MWQTRRKGQGVVESVFAVGILALLLGGAVVLVVLGTSNRRNSFDRRKATELAGLVTEELISQSQNDAEGFWQFDNQSSYSMDGFDGYTYSVGFTNISGNVDYPQCGVGVTDCVETVIKIDWQGKDPQSLYFNRFFSKNE
ncbi:hypothetical protein KKD37_02715 [Patescibacteria group bacterium]|nr:hypothetical protein [Patescibacteria group bacterium]